MITLKKVLYLNAISSGATGLLLVCLSNSVAFLFNASQTLPFLGVGVFLLLFSLFVFYSGSRKKINKTDIQYIILVDIMWVLISLICLVFPLFEVSPLGNELIFAVALWVALMAFLQHTQLKKHNHKQSLY